MEERANMQKRYCASIRVFNQAPPASSSQIICACMECLNFVITDNTHNLDRFMHEHNTYPCGAKMLTSDLSEELKRMLGEI
jgi:hypothetical protein